MTTPQPDPRPVLSEAERAERMGEVLEFHGMSLAATPAGYEITRGGKVLAGELGIDGVVEFVREFAISQAMAPQAPKRPKAGSEP